MYADTFCVFQVCSLDQELGRVNQELATVQAGAVELRSQLDSAQDELSKAALERERTQYQLAERESELADSDQASS